MKISTTKHGQPDQKFIRGIDGLAPTPFDGIEFLDKKVQGRRVLEKIASEEFNSILDSIEQFGEMEMGMIFGSLQRIQTLESSSIKELQSLVIEIVVKNFGLPDEVKKMIVSKLEPDSHMSMDGDKNKSDLERLREKLSDEELAIADEFIQKRKIQNALMMGSGYRAHKMFHGFRESIDTIDDRLLPIYERFLPSVELNLWKHEMPVSVRQVWGKCQITNDKEIKGVASAKLFIILLHETAKIATEILFLQSVEDIYETHGENMKAYVLAMADRYEDEQWMKLIGPRIWKYFHDAVDFIVKDRDNDYQVVSYLINRVGLLEPKEFMSLMSNIVNDGEKAIKDLERLLALTYDNLESHDEFVGENKPQGHKRSLSEMNKQELEKELEKALDAEDYEKAAEIKKIVDSI